MDLNTRFQVGVVFHEGEVDLLHSGVKNIVYNQIIILCGETNGTIAAIGAEFLKEQLNTIPIPQGAPDYARMTKQQRRYLRGMLESLWDIIEDAPGIVTKARASILIEALKPTHDALTKIKEAYEEDGEDEPDDRPTIYLPNWMDES